MSNHGDEGTPTGSEMVNSETKDNQHRVTRSNKAFQDTVNDKLELAICKQSKLISLLKKFEEKQMQELVEVADDYELFTNELKCLLEQDKFDDFKNEAKWLKQDQTASQAYAVVKKQREKLDALLPPLSVQDHTRSVAIGHPHQQAAKLD